MPEDAYPRPSQVTVAGWSLIGGSALLLPTIFDAVANVRSVDTRAALERSVESGAGRSLGISLEQLTELMHQALVVGGAAAAASLILGWFVLRGDRAARVGATVAAVPVLLGSMFAGGFLGALVAAGAGMLWTGPARDWFAGREPRQPRLPQRHHDPAPPAPSAGPDVRVTGPVTGAPPTQGYGQVPSWAPPSGPPVEAPYGFPHPPPAAPSAPVRPAPVQTACVVTWVFSGITAAVGLLTLLSLLAAPDMIVDEVLRGVRERGQSVDADLVEPMLWASGALLTLWSAGASMLALFVWRRQAWARVALVTSAALAGLVSVFAFPLSLLHLAATAWVVGMLLSPLTRAWFRQSG